MRFLILLLLAAFPFAVANAEELSAVVKSYREQIATSGGLAEEMDRIIIGERGYSKAGERVVAEIATAAGRKPSELETAVKLMLADLTMKADDAAAKRIAGHATADDSRAEAGLWHDIARIQSGRGAEGEAREAFLRRMAAMTKFATPEEWLAAGLRTAWHIKQKDDEQGEEWLERCRALATEMSALRTSDKAQAALKFYEAMMSSASREDFAAAVNGVEKAFGVGDSFTCFALEWQAVTQPGGLQHRDQTAAIRRRLIAAYKERFGAQHPATLLATARLGSVLLYAKHPEGPRVLREAVDGWLATSGLGSERRLELARQLASHHRLDGSGSQVVPLLEKMIVISGEVRGAEARETLWLTNDLAICLDESGDIARAEKVNRELLEVRTRVFGAEDSDTMISRNNLAIQISGRGEFREAKEHFEKVHAARLKNGKADDIETLRIRGNIASQLAALGELDEALTIVKEVLVARAAKVGAESADTLASMGQVAWLHLRKGDIAQAEKITSEVLAIREKVFGPNHRWTLTSRVQLAEIHLEKGDTDVALTLAEQVVDYLEKHPINPGNPDEIYARITLGSVYLAAGQAGRAGVLLRDASAATEKLRGPKHISTIRGWIAVAKQQAKTGEPETALTLFLKAYKAAAAISAEHPTVAEAAVELAAVLQPTKPEEAAKYLEEARAIAVKKLHPDAPLRKRCEGK